MHSTFFVQGIAHPSTGSSFEGFAGQRPSTFPFFDKATRLTAGPQSSLCDKPFRSYVRKTFNKFCFTPINP
jgi:hypothetical protein